MIEVEVVTQLKIVVVAEMVVVKTSVIDATLGAWR